MSIDDFIMRLMNCT